jgi:hypothetical protein
MTGHLIIQCVGGVVSYVAHTEDEEAAFKVWREFYREGGFDIADSDTPNTCLVDLDSDNDCYIFDRCDILHLDLEDGG